MKRVAIQGFSGCFHEEAARKYYGDEIETVGCISFDDEFKTLDRGDADAAVIAVENTSSGGLLANFDLLRRSGRKIKGEVYLHIHQNLMALPGQSVTGIKEVHTHYMAINQTRSFFENECPWIRMIESEDTAKSAAEVAQKHLMGVGAVASELAAKEFGLEILAPQIETYKTNFTRFLVIDESISIPSGQLDKASLCFTLPHTPGSLAHILTILSFFDMNLTRIQSLPIPGKQWQYFFYIDLKFTNYARYRQALDAIRPLLDDLDIMGEYISAQQ